MTTVYLVTHKIPEYEVEENKDAFGSKADANRFYNATIKNIQRDYEGEHARCELFKITLRDDLTAKQMFLAMLSQKGYAKNTESIKDWSQH